MPAVERQFLDFAHHLYEQAGVADNCLWLQDQHQLDVMLILFCLWSGHRYGTLAPQAIEQLCAASDPWHSSVVKPLRATRRWLKAQSLAGSADSAVETLRSAIKDNELLAEHMEGELLERTLAASDHPVTHNPGSSAARTNLQRYLALADALNPQVLERTESLPDVAASSLRF